VNKDPEILTEEILKKLEEKKRDQDEDVYSGLLVDRHIRYQSKRGPGPSFVDYFGWCTWDSFYTDLSEEKVLHGLDSFTSTGVTPRFMILDDGWQSTDVDDKINGDQWGGRLHSFGANFKFSPGYNASLSDKQKVGESSGTPRGYEKEDYSLSAMIKKAKIQNKIKYFFVWHALSGYWSGVATRHDRPSSHGASVTIEEGLDSVDGEKVVLTLPRLDLSHDMEVVKVPELGELLHVKSIATIVSNEGRLMEAEADIIFKPKLTKNLSIKDLNIYDAELCFPYMSGSMNRMTMSGELHREPFTLQGVGLIDIKKSKDFFQSYHNHLKSMGVDGVKVDAQSVVYSLRSSRGSSWDVVSQFHSSLKDSVANNFGYEYQKQKDPMSRKEKITELSNITSQADEHVIIHCMCHSPGTLMSILRLYPSPNFHLHRGADERGTIGNIDVLTRKFPLLLLILTYILHHLFNRST
jgi:hypothetical protein